MSNMVYPYRITVPRTGDWYDSGGMWYKLSTWCDECIGSGEWEYYGGDFVFTEEKHFMLFKLKWDRYEQ